MSTYTAREYAEMHFIYGYCNGNGNAAAREYRERYPNREHYPDYRVFGRVHYAYLAGRVPGQPDRSGRPFSLDVDEEEQILELFAQDPTTSTRRVARRSGIPRTTVQRTLKRRNMHAFHVQRVQALQPQDYAARVRFCHEMLRRNREVQFFNKILWTDESSFRRVGIFNIHNLHYWAVENPHIIRDDHFQHQFGVNLWAGIVEGRLIGPVELPSRVSGDTYLTFLQNELDGILEDVNIQTLRDMWLQHDGAPPHFARQVRSHLNERFPNRWIGRGGAIAWPARSPDLNPIDFFLWGYFKEIVYHTENNTEAEVREKIRAAIQQIKNNRRAFRMLKRNFIRRCRLCIRTQGRHFEHLL